MNKKNLWIFFHHAAEPNSTGSTRHYEIGRQLVKRGYQVKIFAADFNHISHTFIPLDPGQVFKVQDMDENGHLQFIWLKTPAYFHNDWRRILNMLTYSRRAAKVAASLVESNVLSPPDIVVGTMVHPFAARTAARIADQFKVPFVFEIQDLWPQTFIDMGIWKENSVGTLYFRRLEKYTVNKAQAFIVLSPLTGQYLQ